MPDEKLQLGFTEHGEPAQRNDGLEAWQVLCVGTTTPKCNWGNKQETQRTPSRSTLEPANLPTTHEGSSLVLVAPVEVVVRHEVDVANAVRMRHLKQAGTRAARYNGIPVSTSTCHALKGRTLCDGMHIAHVHDK